MVTSNPAIQSPVELVFAEARKAQPGWATTPLPTRLQCIRRLRDLIAKRPTAIAKSAGDRLGEILIAQLLPLADACRFLEQSSRELLAPRRLGRRGRPWWLAGLESQIVREPFGVVLIVAPANYPLFLPGVPLLQALVAGNAVLLKPGEGGYPAAIMLRQLCCEAGIDKRLVGILPSTDTAAREAMQLPVDSVLFTGSSKVGKEVLAQLAPRVIPAVLELSGRDVAIIRADADIQLAARALVWALSFNSSATCIAPRRVLVARPCLEQLEAELVARIQAYRAEYGDPRLATAISTSVDAGATWLIGGVSPEGALELPCVLTDVRPAMPILHLDIFKPVLSLVPFDNDREAIAVANDSAFALGASIFSRDEIAAQTLASRVHAGVVTINDVIVPTADPRIPFGGRKQSGFGVTRGAEGLLAMTQPKVIQLRRGRSRLHFDLGLTNRSADLFADFIEMTHARRLGRRLYAGARLLWKLNRMRMK